MELRKFAGRDHDKETEHKRMGSRKMLGKTWPTGGKELGSVLQVEVAACTGVPRWHLWGSKRDQCGGSNRRKSGRQGGWERWGHIKMLRFYSPAVESSKEIKAGASCALIYAFKSLLWVENGLSRSRVEVRKPLRSSELSTVLVI